MTRKPSSHGTHAASGARRHARPDSFAQDASAYSRSAYTNASGASSHDPGAAPSAYSRSSVQSDYAKMRAKKHRKKKAVVAVVSVLIALVVCCGAAAFAYMGVLNGKLTGDVGADLAGVLDKTSAPSDPFYVLLMGVDRSEERTDSGEYGDSFRSDSMILARIDPKEKKMTLVSIVRDTYVDIEGYGRNKINAAHALGGPALTVKTVSKFAGVPISHYAEIDFDGFKAAVDALGGIDVDVPIEIDDADAGGYVPAGLQTLDGDQALILCRARHAYDEIGAGDFYRAANQRMVMGAIAQKLLASDPATIASTVASLCDYIDTDMNVTDIVNVAVAMKGMDTSTDIYSTMNPTISSYENGVWYEYSNNEAWSVMMERIDAGEPPTTDASDSANNGGVTDGSIEPDTIAKNVLEGEETVEVTGTIDVRNGSGLSGVAASASSKLTNRGYSIAEVGDADSYDYGTTMVVYDDPEKAASARAISEALGVGTAVQNDGNFVFSGDYLVIVGADYQG